MTQTLLGIDYGDTNVGLAIATTPLAEPLFVVPLSKAINTIIGLIESHQVDAIVVGLSEGETAIKTKRFAQDLKSRFDIPIYFQDETLSTQETNQKLSQANLKRSKQRSLTDHYVATNILQDFIDTHPPLDEPAKTAKI